MKTSDAQKVLLYIKWHGNKTPSTRPIFISYKVLRRANRNQNIFGVVFAILSLRFHTVYLGLFEIMSVRTNPKLCFTDFFRKINENRNCSESQNQSFVWVLRWCVGLYKSKTYLFVDSRLFQKEYRKIKLELLQLVNRNNHCPVARGPLLGTTKNNALRKKAGMWGLTSEIDFILLKWFVADKPFSIGVSYTNYGLSVVRVSLLFICFVRWLMRCQQNSKREKEMLAH